MASVVALPWAQQGGVLWHSPGPRMVVCCGIPLDIAWRCDVALPWAWRGGAVWHPRGPGVVVLCRTLLGLAWWCGVALPWAWCGGVLCEGNTPILASHTSLRLHPTAEDVRSCTHGAASDVNTVATPVNTHRLPLLRSPRKRNHLSRPPTASSATQVGEMTFLL